MTIRINRVISLILLSVYFLTSTCIPVDFAQKSGRSLNKQAPVSCLAPMPRADTSLSSAVSGKHSSLRRLALPVLSVVAVAVGCVIAGANREAVWNFVSGHWELLLMGISFIAGVFGIKYLSMNPFEVIEENTYDELDEDDDPDDFIDRLLRESAARLREETASTDINVRQAAVYQQLLMRVNIMAADGTMNFVMGNRSVEAWWGDFEELFPVLESEPKYTKVINLDSIYWMRTQDGVLYFYNLAENNYIRVSRSDSSSGASKISITEHPEYSIKKEHVFVPEFKSSGDVINFVFTRFMSTGLDLISSNTNARYKALADAMEQFFPAEHNVFDSARYRAIDGAPGFFAMRMKKDIPSNRPSDVFLVVYDSNRQWYYSLICQKNEIDGGRDIYFNALCPFEITDELLFSPAAPYDVYMYADTAMNLPSSTDCDFNPASAAVAAAIDRFFPAPVSNSELRYHKLEGSDGVFWIRYPAASKVVKEDEGVFSLPPVCFYDSQNNRYLEVKYGGSLRVQEIQKGSLSLIASKEKPVEHLEHIVVSRPDEKDVPSILRYDRLPQRPEDIVQYMEFYSSICSGNSERFNAFSRAANDFFPVGISPALKYEKVGELDDIFWVRPKGKAGKNTIYFYIAQMDTYLRVSYIRETRSVVYEYLSEEDISSELFFWETSPDIFSGPEKIISFARTHLLTEGSIAYEDRPVLSELVGAVKTHFPAQEETVFAPLKGHPGVYYLSRNKFYKGVYIIDFPNDSFLEIGFTDEDTHDEDFQVFASDKTLQPLELASYWDEKMLFEFLRFRLDLKKGEQLSGDFWPGVIDGLFFKCFQMPQKDGRYYRPVNGAYGIYVARFGETVYFHDSDKNEYYIVDGFKYGEDAESYDIKKLSAPEVPWMLRHGNFGTMIKSQNDLFDVAKYLYLGKGKVILTMSDVPFLARLEEFFPLSSGADAYYRPLDDGHQFYWIRRNWENNPLYIYDSFKNVYYRIEYDANGQEPWLIVDTVTPQEMFPEVPFVREFDTAWSLFSYASGYLAVNLRSLSLDRDHEAQVMVRAVNRFFPPAHKRDKLTYRKLDDTQSPVYWMRPPVQKAGDFSPLYIYDAQRDKYTCIKVENNRLDVREVGESDIEPEQLWGIDVSVASVSVRKTDAFSGLQATMSQITAMRREQKNARVFITGMGGKRLAAVTNHRNKINVRVFSGADVALWQVASVLASPDAAGHIANVFGVFAAMSVNGTHPEQRPAYFSGFEECSEEELFFRLFTSDIFERFRSYIRRYYSSMLARFLYPLRSNPKELSEFLSASRFYRYPQLVTALNEVFDQKGALRLSLMKYREFESMIASFDCWDSLSLYVARNYILSILSKNSVASLVEIADYPGFINSDPDLADIVANLRKSLKTVPKERLNAFLFERAA